MSVLAKARKGGVDYLYSVLLGYEDPPAGVTLDEGVYYNKFMYGNKIKMPKVLEEVNELIEAVENNTNKVHETADVLYHLIVYLEANNVKMEDVMKELDKRKK